MGQMDMGGMGMGGPMGFNPMFQGHMGMGGPQVTELSALMRACICSHTAVHLHASDTSYLTVLWTACI